MFFKFPKIRRPEVNSSEESSDESFEVSSDKSFGKKFLNKIKKGGDESSILFLGLGSCGYNIVDMLYEKHKVIRNDTFSIDYDKQIKKDHFKRAHCKEIPMGGDFISGEKNFIKAFEPDDPLWDDETTSLLRTHIGAKHEIKLSFMGGGGGSGNGIFRAMLNKIDKSNFKHLVPCVIGPFDSEPPELYFNILAWLGKIIRFGLATGIYVDNDHLMCKQNEDFKREWEYDTRDIANNNFIKYIDVLIQSYATYDKKDLGKLPRALGLLQSRYAQFPLSTLGYSIVRPSGNYKFDAREAFEKAMKDIQSHILGETDGLDLIIFVIMPALMGDSYIQELRDIAQKKCNNQVNAVFAARYDTPFIEMTILASGEIVPAKLCNTVKTKSHLVEQRINYFARENSDAEELVEEARMDINTGIEYINNLVS